MELSRPEYWSGYSFLQGIFITQQSNPCLLRCRWILYELSHHRSPRILEWVVYPFFGGSFWPRSQTRVSCTGGEFFINWATREVRYFRYDLNQTPYDYTVEVTNRLKGLGLIDSAWSTVDGGSWHCTGGGDQNHPQGEKKMQKGKMVVWGVFTNSWEKKITERQRRNGKSSKDEQGEIRKLSSVVNAKKKRKTIEWERDL